MLFLHFWTDCILISWEWKAPRGARVPQQGFSCSLWEKKMADVGRSTKRRAKCGRASDQTTKRQWCHGKLACISQIYSAWQCSPTSFSKALIKGPGSRRDFGEEILKLGLFLSYLFSSLLTIEYLRWLVAQPLHRSDFTTRLGNSNCL